MDRDVVIAFISILPQLIVILAIIGALVSLREPFVRHVLPRLSGIRFIGLEVSLQPADVRQARSNSPAVRRHRPVSKPVSCRARRVPPRSFGPHPSRGSMTAPTSRCGNGA